MFYKALAEPDLAKRKVYLTQAQKIQHERGGMLIWGFSHTIDAATKNIGGLAPEHTIFPTWRFEKLWKAQAHPFNFASPLYEGIFILLAE